MLRSITLLERITAAVKSGGSRTVLEDRAEVHRSILRNLQNILNSRTGHAAAQMDLGIPSPHELMLGFPSTLEQAQEAIRQCIHRYEPRLTAITVKYVKNEESSISICFQIAAILAGEGPRDAISFQTAISSDGRIRLKDR